MIAILILQCLSLLVSILLVYNATLIEKNVRRLKQLHDMEIRILNARVDNVGRFHP